MKIKYKNINRVFKVIEKNLFTIHSTIDYDRVTDCLILLSQLIVQSDSDEDIWSIGECSYCSLDDLIIGAYWHYSEWHNGQSSKGYLALCCLGRIYTPNMETVDIDNESYIQLEAMIKEAT